MTLVTYGSGWLAAALLAVAILAAGLTFVRRRASTRPTTGWVRAHNWIGGAAATVGITHGMLSVTRDQLAVGAEIGLWVASAAAALLIWEAGLGVLLSAPHTPHRARLRRRHLAIMLALVVAVTVHVVLNGPVPR